jgi:hypothetical protein
MEPAKIRKKASEIITFLSGTIHAQSLKMLSSFKKFSQPEKKPLKKSPPKGDSRTGSSASPAFGAKLRPLPGQFLKVLDLQRVPEGKRKPMLFGLVGVVLLFIVIITVPVKRTPKKNASPASEAGFSSSTEKTDYVPAAEKPKVSAPPAFPAGISIPTEELFFPDEPDFVPEFLLEREPRVSWSLEDIRQYWRVPFDSGSWSSAIKTTVDALMENVQ